MSNSAHESSGALSAYLSAHGVEHEIVEHAAAYTASSEARAAAVPPDQAAKTVVLEHGGDYLLALVPASERLDLHKLREVLGVGRSLRLAGEDEIAARFGQFEVGSVPPVGDAVFAGEIVDRRLTDLDRMLCSAGDHRHSVSVSPADVVRLAGARVADICED
jgi:Ala-tRNA(Pro) deacylase